ncbi:hypothetical protein MNBD_GAMMA01-1296 [hydrothermal vent metagenome]|uniref:Helicase n=1 Tax=hydrothermal vent metagenome TaxID=652676 RepID=A0A3B0VE26_9ZZZZ
MSLFDYSSDPGLAPIDLKPLSKDFELREVQDKALLMLRASLRQGNKRVIMHIGTGGGKTILAGKLFHMIFKKNLHARVFFIVPRVTLLHQTKKVFEEVFGYDCGIIQGGNRVELNKHVQIATIQTLNNRLNSDKMDVYNIFRNIDISAVVVDEVHLEFKGFKTVMDVWEPLMIGLTATPFTKGMGKMWQDIVRPVPMAELISDGTLSKYKVVACTPIDRSKLTTMSTGEYKDEDVDNEVERITGDVFEEWNKSSEMKGRPFLLFAKSIKSCVAIAEHFSRNGVKIGYVHSKMSEEDIQNEINAFKSGYFIGLASVVMLIEGFDYPDVSAMIMCAPLAPSKSDPNIPNSCNRYVQMAGRGLRAKSDDGYCLIHDHSGNFINYGEYEYIEELFPGLDNGKKVKKVMSPTERKERAVRECFMCGCVIKTNKCPDCGTETKKPTQFLQAGDLIFEAGEMVELKSVGTRETSKYRTKSLSPELRLEFAQELKGYVASRRESYIPIKKEKGFYSHKYKERTGNWPGRGYRFNEVGEIEPSKAFMSYMESLKRQYRNEQKSRETKQAAN